MRRCLCALLALCLLGAAAAEGLPGDYEAVRQLSANRWLVRKGGLWGVADAAGEIVLAPQFREEPAFADGYAVVEIVSETLTSEVSGVEEPAVLQGVIDAEGNICIPCEYDSVELGEGAALVREGNEYRYLTMDGAPLTKRSYFRARPFENGYAAVAVRVETVAETSDPYAALWGLIDREGNEVIPCQYERLELGDGPALVAVAGDDGALRYGYVGLDGTTVVEPRYGAAEPFVDGYAAVAVRVELAGAGDSEGRASAWGALDAEGREVLPTEYDAVTVHAGGRIEALLDGETYWFTVEDGVAAAADAP